MPRCASLRPRPHLAVVCAGLCLCLATAGCGLVEQQAQYVVKQVPGTLVFGPPKVTITPAPSAPTSTFSGGAEPYTIPVVTPAPLVIIPATPSPAAASACPVPGSNVFPAEPATPDVDIRPSEGVYDYRASGQVTSGGTATPLPTSDALSRQLHGLAAASDPSNSTAYTYAVGGGFGFQAIDGKLTAGFQARPTSGDPAPPPPTAGGPAPTPQDGLFLSSLSFTPVAGQPSITFASPAAGVQLFQAPATNQASWQSSVTDATHGVTISFKGGINTAGDPTKNGKEDVTGCGQVFEAWRVDGTLAITGPGIAITDAVTFDIGSQYGGLILAEHDSLDHAVIGTADLSGTDLTTILDALPPAPLPKGVS